MIDKVREWRRRSLGWQLRHANPRGLTRREYRTEMATHKVALRKAMASLVEEPDYYPRVVRARGEAIRRAMAGPAMTRDQAAALLTRELIAEANRD